MPWQDVRPSVRLSHAGFLSKRLYTVFQKTCDHVFDNKLNQNCPFTKIFGILITKTIGHQQVFLVHTYSMQLLYLGKLSIPKYYEYSLKVLIFSMQQYEDINCKTVTILFYNRTITRFIADDKVVYHRVRWEMRLASDNSWTRRLKHLSWRSRWIILCTLEQRMAVSCEISRADWCFLVCPRDWARGPPLLRAERGLPLPGIAGQLYPSCGFSSADCRCFQLSNHCQEIHSASFVYHTVLADRELKSKYHLSVNCSLFCLILYRYLGIDSFPR